MDSEAQTVAYAEADFNESNSLFTQRFMDTFPDLPATGRMADLGCGPGDIAIRMAGVFAGWQVTGLDAGENMLKRAQERLRETKLADRVQFRLCYLPDDSLQSADWDAVISNSLLHHLPDPQVLWDSIARIAAPGAAVQVMDLLRPPTQAEAQRLVDVYAADAPDILREDFYHSLLAAYTTDEIAGQLHRAGLDYLKVELASDRHWIVSGRLRG